MSKFFTTLVLGSLAALAVIGPASAGNGVPIPEPTTLGLIAGGIAAGIVLARLRRRK